MTDSSTYKRETLPVPETSLEAREQLINSLRLDLVGPWHGHELAKETLSPRFRPSNWYLTGFLIPADTSAEDRGDDDSDEDFDDVSDGAGVSEENTDDRKAARKSFFPTSMGLTFLVDPAATTLNVTIRWGDYADGELPPRTPEENPMQVWQRHPREVSVPVDLKALTEEPHDLPVPNSGGLKVTVLGRSFQAQQTHDELPAGTRSVSVFLVNGRVPVPGHEDVAYAFQPQIVVQCDRPFMPRPDLRGLRAGETDEHLADLHFSDAPELAAGHGVSVDWSSVDGECRELRTEWMPRGDVERTVTARLDGVELEMEALGALEDGEAARRALMPLVEEYRAWIEARRSELGALIPRRQETAESLLHDAGIAATRIEAGIAVLEAHPDALHAFCVANRAVGRALRKRLSKDVQPSWRVFQLAFLLPRGGRGPDPSQTRDCRSAVLPNGRWQDGGLPRARCLHDGPAASSKSGPHERRRVGADALHAASVDARSARPRSGVSVRT